MNTSEISIEILSGGQSSLISISTTSAQGPVVVAPTNHPANVPVKCLITPTVDCYVRQGSNPTALSDGTDQILKANLTYRTEILPGNRIAAITASGTGSINFTPGA